MRSLSEIVGAGRRLPDWPERLSAFLRVRQESPKQWGFNDCALLCADAIETMTGVDPAWELRGYDSPGGALKALVRYLQHRRVPVPAWRHQPDSLLSEVAARLAHAQGFAPSAAGLAQRGDAVLLDIGGIGLLEETPKPRWTLALGVVGMHGLPVTAGERGTVELAAVHIVKAWRV